MMSRKGLSLLLVLLLVATMVLSACGTGAGGNTTGDDTLATATPMGGDTGGTGGDTGGTGGDTGGADATPTP